MKKAIIIGITGQDGAYLARYLLNKNYKVYGTYRRTSSLNFWRLQELGVENHEYLELIEYDLTDQGASIRMMINIHPDEVYNLGAQSFVAVSFELPITTSQITGIGCLHLLEAIRTVNPKIKYYQASTSELYGMVQEVPQDENTPFYPRSPYAVSKLYAHWATVNYRESYGMYACSGILFNHESPLRGIEFVTRKISYAVARYKIFANSSLELGNLNAKRDWGYAEDYVKGMHMMLQQKEPQDIVLATGKTFMVRDFVELAFRVIDVEIIWKNEGLEEQGINKNNGDILVTVNPKYFRPSEVDLLIGNPNLARTKLGWKPSVKLEDLCAMMVKSDIERLSQNNV